MLALLILLTVFIAKIEKHSLSSSKALITIHTDLVDIGAIIKEIQGAKVQLVTITAYHPPSRGINSDSDPNRTALMVKPKPGWTAVISRNMIKYGWIGKKIYAPNIGVWKIEGVMGKEVIGNQIDLCFPSHKKAMAFGVKRNIMMTAFD
uniref:3D domain-containing protein n=1 Tax=viral metagenome TaxID=1070528 RepID=A0A6M3J261_9ZZZZ